MAFALNLTPKINKMPDKSCKYRYGESAVALGCEVSSIYLKDVAEATNIELIEGVDVECEDVKAVAS